MSKLKILQKKSVPSIIQENIILQQLNCQFIANMYFAFQSKENLYLIMNYYQKGEDFDIRRLDSLSTLPADFKANNSCADIHFHPNGKFLYGSNRGHNSIVVYAVDTQTGKLMLLQHQSTRGEIPRNFLVTPDGKWLLAANQNSSTVAAFHIDAATGLLSPAGEPSAVPTPVCLKLLM